MADAQQQEWPNRRTEILLTTITVGILSTVMLIWRTAYGVMNKRKLLVCDYLLILAGLFNVVSMSLRFTTTAAAQGRHIEDPSIKKPDDMLTYSLYVYLAQNMNLFGMAVLKWSICAYLLALKFSKLYTAIVWASIALVTVFNFMIPCFGFFSCTPFEKNWNRAAQGSCWYKGPMVLSYAQGVTNIITDIIYVVAPILYLSTIQLPKRTQWGLRIVFCLGLVVTVCSVFKTVELHALTKTRDPTWDAVNLTIWSATELSVGILIASLPPLRKVFDDIFRRIIPMSFSSKSRQPDSLPLHNVSKSSTKPYSKPMGRSESASDGDSEKDILPGPKESGIIKTVVHELTHSQRDDSNESLNNITFEKTR